MKKLILPAIFAALALASCRKEGTNTPVTSSAFRTYSSMDEVFNMLEVKPVSVMVDAGIDTSFYGPGGTRFTFSKNSVMFASGASVSGKIQLDVYDYVKKGDMMFSGVLPVSNGEPLISGGEINVVASQSGNRVFLKPGSSFSANIPRLGNRDKTAMNFFSGVPGGPVADKVNWQIQRDTAQVVNVVFPGFDTFNIISDSFRFCNADVLMTSPNFQSFKVTLVAPAGVSISDDSKIYTYSVYDGYKAMWMLYNRSGNTCDEHHVPDIPVHFVSYGLLNGHFYGGVLAATPKTGSTYTITLTEVDPLDFKGQINAL